MLPLIKNFYYRPEIDGLRAVAVVAVVLFHAGLGVPGGYVGVDVFFVISGYLITSLIVKDLERGTFSLRTFWERRIRRILPALLVVVASTLAAAWFLLLPDDYAKLGKSATYQAFFAANIYFWRDTGYFSGAAELKPLLHTWSLAVEEQYYLILPLASAGLFRFAPFRQRGVILLLIGAAILISLGGSIYGSHRYPAATFYLLPTRAWELLVGSFLALMPWTLLPRQQFVREATAIVGLAGILFPCFLYTSETRFPGLAALPVCLGTFLVIFACGVFHGDVTLQSTFVGRMLSTRPVVFVGLISYSLYLWHWPLLAFAKYHMLFPQRTEIRILLVAAGFGMAILSYYLVETPIRARRLFNTDRHLVPFAAATLAVTMLGAAIIWQNSGFPNRLSVEARRFSEAGSDFAFNIELDAADVPDNLVRLGSADADPRILVWGDSHAMAILPAIDAICRETGVSARAATHSSTAPVLGYYKTTKHGLNEKSLPFSEAVEQYIHSNDVESVLLAAMWEAYLSDGDADAFESALLRTVNSMQSAGAKVYFMRQVPAYDFDVARALTLSALTHRQGLGTQLSLSSSQQADSRQERLLAVLRSFGVIVLDPLPVLQQQGGGFPFDTAGSFYKDSHHLSTHGALAMKSLFLPLLQSFRR